MITLSDSVFTVLGKLFGFSKTGIGDGVSAFLITDETDDKASLHNPVATDFEGGEIFDSNDFLLYGVKITALNGIDAMSRLIYRTVEPGIDDEMKELIDFIRQNKSLLLMGVDREVDPEKNVEKKVREFLDEHYGKVNASILSRIFYYIKKEFMGVGALDVLFIDPRIEDISVSGDGQSVYVMLPGGGKTREGYYKTNISPKEKDYQDMLLRVGQVSNLTPSFLTPILDGTIDRNQDRVNLVYGNQISPAGGAFTIRAVKETPFTVADLIVEREVNVEMIAWLWYMVEKGASGLIFGSTGSGKTTLLNALLFFVPAGRKVVVIEDTRELRLPGGTNWTVGITRKPSMLESGYEPISLHDQLVSALRLRPDYITVGEIRGREAYTLFDAMSTGHTGYGTVHAGGLEDVQNRFASNPSVEGSMYIPPALQNSMNFLVHISQVILPEAGVFQRRRVLNIWENKPAEYRTHGTGKVSIAPEFVKDRLGRGLFTYNSVMDSFEGLSEGVLEGYLLDYYAGMEGMSHENALKDLNRRATVINYIVAERAHLNPFQMYLAINYYTKLRQLKESWLKYAVNLPYEEGV